jgi:Tfp pilus assembly protein PilF
MDKNLKNQVDKIINFFNVGNYNKVLELSQILIKKNPNFDYILNIVGLCYQKLNDYEKAESFFLKTININRDNFSAQTNLANNYKYKLDFKKAEETYVRTLKRNPNHLSTILNYGNLKFLTNKNEDALKLLENALKINDKIVPIHLNIAIVLQSLGEFKNTINHLEKINNIDPTFTRSDKMKSLLIDYKDNDNHLNQMMEKLKNLKLDDNQKINIYFAIAKAFEDLKDYENSFKYIKLGNDLKFKNSNYNIKNDFEKTERIKKVFEKINFNEKPKYTEKVEPIFIIGMPRSGTTLVEQIISSHKDVQGLGELNLYNNISNNKFLEKNIFTNLELSQAHIKEITKNYINLLSNYEVQTNKFTDKTLLNFNWVGLIKLCFPNAKIINCLRNPKDNLLSIYKNLFDHEGAWCYDEDSLVKYYKLYKDIINFWQTKLPNYIYEIKYEDLINNPKFEINNLLKFCDLDWDNNCLEFNNNKTSIKTLSVKQARSKMYKTSIDSFNNYKRYSENLFKEL